MNLTIQPLFFRLFDYAGLFPPANLSLKSAMDNYLEYQTHAYHKMLGKFILPTKLLQNASELLGAQKLKTELSFSILLSTPKSESEIQPCLTNDLKSITSFIQNPKCEITSFEFCLPLECFGLPQNKLFYLFDNFVDQLFSFKKNQSSQCDVFFELPFLSIEDMTHFISCMTQYNTERSQTIFIKLRTGGTTPQSIPMIHTLSSALILLAQNKLAYKVTAGLHSPVPYFNRSVNAQMHGYLNVLFASIFSVFFGINDSCSLSKTNSNIQKILQTLDYSHIKIVDDSVSISIDDFSFSVSHKQLSEFRKKYFKGIGTCDFLEPIDLFLKNSFYLYE